MTRYRRNDLVRKLLITGAVLTALLAALVAAGRYSAREAQRERFAPELEGYVAHGLPRGEGPAYRSGKLVLVRMPVTEHRAGWGEVTIEPAMLDDLHFALPSGLQATRPDEVGTVVLCAHRKRKLPYEYRHDDARPATGVRAFRHDILLTLVDRTRGMVCGRILLEGGPPPEELDIGGSISGPPPDVLAWLEALPAKP